jgi:hypothetical protein
MTFAEMASEAVLVASAQTLAIVAVIFCGFRLVVAGYQVLGRGAESVWPEGPEPQQADAPRSTSLLDRIAASIR